MGKKIYLNGKFVERNEAKISVFDHGLLYGDGVFEGIRAYNGRLFRLDEHLDRLCESAHTIMLKMPVDRKEITKIVKETVRINNLRDAYIRLVVTRGVGDLGLDPRKCKKPTVFCIADSIALYPESLYRKGLDIVTVAIRRNLSEAVSPRLKSLNYLNNILGKVEANRAGVAEALMLDANGFVSECTGDNIFIVKNKALITPPPHVGILKGITRGVIIQIAKKEKMEVREELFTRHDVYNADECFLTGTAAEVIPVVKVDGRNVRDGKPGKITNDLIKKFRALAKKEGVPIYKK